VNIHIPLANILLQRSENVVNRRFDTYRVSDVSYDKEDVRHL